MKIEKKPHHPTTGSRPFYMIFRNYNTNLVIDARPRCDWWTCSSFAKNSNIDAILESSIIVPLNHRQQKTLTQIFRDPVLASIAWSDIESLLRALGAEIAEGRGSRVRIVLNGVRAVFHRPHPEPTTDKGAVKSVRRFLTETGIQP
jgi:hypothetical protein